MGYGWSSRRRMSLQPLLLLFALVTGLGLLLLALKPMDPPITVDFPRGFELEELDSSSLDGGGDVEPGLVRSDRVKSCATVEEMGEDFRRDVRKESLRVRRIIENHFLLNGIIGAFLISVYVVLDFCILRFLILVCLSLGSSLFCLKDHLVE